MNTMKSHNLISRFRFLAALAFSAALAACSGGGPGTTENPITGGPSNPGGYTGNPAATPDTQAFQNALWVNVKPNDRCGQCHGAGGQAPTFARADDVNLAYQAANGVVNFTKPEDSRLVTKVASGHNCWLASPQACADTLTVWIRNWVGATAGGGGNDVPLQPPPASGVGSGKSFPAGPNDSSPSFAATVYPVLTTVGECGRCHAVTAPTKQQPFFASADLTESYAASKPKINLDTPTLSRFVVRLKTESHNCWSGDCAADAAVMLKAINDYAGGIAAKPIDTSLILSKALRLKDGTVASGGNRVETNIVAKYEFKGVPGKEADDANAYDTSGVQPAADLNFVANGTVEWVGGWGVNIKPTGKLVGNSMGSKKIADQIKSSGEFTVEAWVAPANVAQMDAHIVTYAGGATTRNFTLGQKQFQYEARVRSSKTNADGAPAMLTREADKDAQAALQHVVMTYDAVGGRKIYVNGAFTGDADAQGGGTLGDWDDTYVLSLGNDATNNKPWVGVIKFLAIHNRALTAAQIDQNFKAGVGERYYLLFDVSEVINLPQSYVMMEAIEFDTYAYLFTKPTFISLNPNVDPANLVIKGVRIGVNGVESKVGQAFSTISATVAKPEYTAEKGMLLASGGTLVPVEKGAADDLFFLSFEQLGSRTHVFVEAEPTVVPKVDAAIQPPRIGVRTFDEINGSFSAITTVPTNTAKVRTTFTSVKQALPSTESVEAFLASHQSAIGQLAISYCDVLATDATRRAQFFPGLNFGAAATTYFGATAGNAATDANRALLIDPLLVKAAGLDLASTEASAIAARTAMRAELNLLINTMLTRADSNVAARTPVVVKGVCSAVLGSSAVAIQ